MIINYSRGGPWIKLKRLENILVIAIIKFIVISRISADFPAMALGDASL